MTDKQLTRNKYWESISRDAAAVAQLPYSVRGGSAAMEEEEELRALDATINKLRAEIRNRLSP